MFLASNAFAYGSFYYYPEDKGGEPYRWQNGKIIWYYDEGPLSSKVPLNPKSSCDMSKDPCSSAMISCGILNCIVESFSDWNKASMATIGPDGNKKTVKIADLKIIQGGKAGMDINGDNWEDLSNRLESKTDNSNPVAYIVFDADGSILQKIWGSSNDLPLGLTILYKNHNSPYYNAGMVIYNGLAFDGIMDERVKEASSATEFAATVVHELGHLLGLDHTQPLREVLGSSENDAPDKPTGVPTMYPSNITENQANLHIDDMVGLAFLYWDDGTTEEFKKSFCSIEGEMMNAKEGTGYQGINMLAYVDSDNEVEKYSDQRSFVSGSLMAPHTTDGRYKFHGIIPGVPYRVVYEAVMPKFQTGFAGGINPYAIDRENPYIGPAESDFERSSNPVLSPSGFAAVACDLNKDSDPKLATAYSAKQSTTEVFEKNVISMKASDAPPPDDSKTSTDGTQSNGTGSKKKGWFGCSLVLE